MSEHYTKNTVSATAWCAKCGKPTEHRVDSGRLGPCLPCLRAPLPSPVSRAPKSTQGFLFGEEKRA
jgi:hypothetical protein